MIALEVLPLCNHCGACCQIGGSCVIRRWGGGSMDLHFDGRCELLIDQPDGSTRCAHLAKAPQELLPRFGIRGVCDFPDLRHEIVRRESV
jgi:hypothetical protein